MVVPPLPEDPARREALRVYYDSLRPRLAAIRSAAAIVDPEAWLAERGGGPPTLDEYLAEIDTLDALCVERQAVLDA